MRVRSYVLIASLLSSGLFQSVAHAEKARVADVIVNSIGIKLEYIEPGEFLMGSPDSNKEHRYNESPQHMVRLTNAFYMGVTEVTQAQWIKVMDSSPLFGKERVRMGDRYPATYVSWNDAVEFCKKLSQKEGSKYRLPTEAEWEYACRAGTKTQFSFGNDENRLGDYAWFDKNTSGAGEDYPHTVAQKKPNQWGLYDMHGNVEEWCGDWIDFYWDSPTVDPKGPPTGRTRVLRGGAWYGNPEHCRSASRRGLEPDARNKYREIGYIGFRIVLELDEGEDGTEEVINKLPARKDHSDLIAFFARYAGLTRDNAEGLSSPEEVSEFEESIRSKSNEDILWETLGLVVNMSKAPADLKRFYEGVIAGKNFVEEEKVQEALMNLVPGWGYVKAVNRGASLNIAKEIIHAAYEHRFREQNATLYSSIEDMSAGEEQEKTRAVFHHICPAYADHGLYFTLVSPKTPWPNIEAHLDEYVESTARNSEEVSAGEYEEFLSAAVSEYRAWLRSQLDSISKTVYRLDKIEERFSKLYDYSHEQESMSKKEAIGVFRKEFQAFLDGSDERKNLYESLLSERSKESDALLRLYRSGELLEREMDAFELKLLGVLHPGNGHSYEFQEALAVLRGGCIKYAEKCKIAPHELMERLNSIEGIVLKKSRTADAKKSLVNRKEIRYSMEATGIDIKWAASFYLLKSEGRLSNDDEEAIRGIIARYFSAVVKLRIEDIASLCFGKERDALEELLKGRTAGGTPSIEDLKADVQKAFEATRDPYTIVVASVICREPETTSDFDDITRCYGLQLSPLAKHRFLTIHAPHIPQTDKKVLSILTLYKTNKGWKIAGCLTRSRPAFLILGPAEVRAMSEAAKAYGVDL